MHKDFKITLANRPVKQNITLCGPVNRTSLQQHYQESSAFILPSIEDGFGMVMGEAMAAGLPVIATTHTGAPDVITEGKEGFIIPPGNPQVLAERLRWLYKHPQESFIMGAAGCETIKNFSWNYYGERIIKTYQNILR